MSDEVEREDCRVRPGASPLHVRAVMARLGIRLNQLLSYEDPERGYVNPLDEREAQGAVRVFMADLDKWLVEGQEQ